MNLERINQTTYGKYFEYEIYSWTGRVVTLLFAGSLVLLIKKIREIRKSSFADLSTTSNSSSLVEMETSVSRKINPPVELNSEQERQKLVPYNNRIGKGEHGEVYQHANNPNLAVKCLHFSLAFKEVTETSKKKIINEYEIGAQLNHPNIGKSFDLYILKNKCHIVMEKIEGEKICSFFDEKKVPSFSYELIGKWLNQLKSCCLHLFKEGIAWEDVNGENIMITAEKSIKLIDFGSWKKVKNDQELAVSLIYYGQDAIKYILSTVMGYTSPEFYKAEIILVTKGLFKDDFELVWDTDFLQTVFAYKSRLEEEVTLMNRDQLKKFIGNYFDLVIQKFRRKTKK